MKNIRFLITVLALINAGLVAQASAAPTTTGNTVSTGSANPTANGKVFIGCE
jgi:hypothetical protein